MDSKAVAPRTDVNIGAFDRHTRDWIVHSTAENTRAVLTGHGLPAHGVVYVPSTAMLHTIARELLQAAPPSVHGRADQRRGGGTASNVLYNIGCIQIAESDKFPLTWFGTMGHHPPLEFVTPIDELRRVGVRVNCSPETGDDALALCVVEGESRSIIVVVVARGAPTRAAEAWPEVDVAIIGFDTLVNAGEPVRRWVARNPAIALLVDRGSTPASDPRLPAEETLVKHLRWVIGRREDLSALALFDDEPSRVLRHCEIIATSGPDPVIVWDPVTQTCRRVAVPVAPAVDGDELGAGDAYAGAYLYGRLTGRSISSAHDLAASWAGRALEIRGARLPPPADLNRIFGAVTRRRSTSRSEAKLFERVRLTHGLTVITGGQTGVDQLGLECADALGLAAFAIVPDGGRTELPESPFTENTAHTEACVVALDSDSFRFRTWANAYFGDGTLIWDLHGGEGSRATRQACQFLGRPYLDLAGNELDEIVRRVMPWAAEHRIRVVNIAGNRRSLLSAAEVAEVRSQIYAVLRCLAVDWARRNRTAREIPPVDITAASSRAGDRGVLRLGAADAAAYRSFIENFFYERLHGDALRPRTLVGISHEAGIQVAFLRARELPRLLAEGSLDAIVCGADVIEESGIDAGLLVQTGLFNQVLAFIAPNEPPERKLRLVSQYPRLARRALEKTHRPHSLKTISGSAEAWLNLGLADAALDTWRTGRTAEANGLRMWLPAGVTSLVMATSPAALDRRKSRILQLAREFEGWLGC